MKYDHIMCMMVDDAVKTKDRDPYAYEEIKKDIQMMKSGKASYITKNELIGRISHSFNNRTPQSGGITKEQKTELMNLVMSSKDEKTIDKAIKMCDYAYGTAEIKDVNGKWVVYNSGKYVQEFDNSDDAEAFVREKGWH